MRGEAGEEDDDDDDDGCGDGDDYNVVTWVTTSTSSHGESAR
jgi:hypothetical protein